MYISQYSLDSNEQQHVEIWPFIIFQDMPLKNQRVCQSLW